MQLTQPTCTEGAESWGPSPWLHAVLSLDSFGFLFPRMQFLEVGGSFQSQELAL